MGAEAHDGAVPPSDDPQPVRRFGACTVALSAVADWLTAGRMTTGARESPGVYWRPRFELVETGGVEVMRVAPQQGHKSHGRPQSEGHDGPWRQRRHTFGLLTRAFRPQAPGGVRRRYLRPRTRLLSYARDHIQHRPKALPQMHSTPQQVVSAITGVPGRAISRAIGAGEGAPVPWARLRNYRGPPAAAARAKALHGQWRDEHVCALAQAVAVYDVYHQKSAAGDRPREAHLHPVADPSDGPPLPPGLRPRQRTRNRPPVEVRRARQRMTGGDLSAIEGMDEPTALPVLSVSGRDRGRWPPGQHVTSWLGRCPPHRVSGGKVFSRRTKPCANRATTAVRGAAASLHPRQSALGALCRRRKARVGTPTALTATAHKLARCIYTMLQPGTVYVRRRLAEYEHQSCDRVVQHLTRRAQALGYVLLKTPETTPA